MYMSGATKKCKLVSEVKSKAKATLHYRTSLENRKNVNRTDRIWSLISFSLTVYNFRFYF